MNMHVYIGRGKMKPIGRTRNRKEKNRNGEHRNGRTGRKII
jgi:hypothetical protein